MYGRGNQMGFGPPVTPPIIKNLIIANVVIFAAQQFSPLVTTLGSVTPYLVWHELFLWQPFTYMWLHGGLMHILFNMWGLWIFGSELALAWGEQRFLRFYLTCGVGAGLLIAIYPYLPWVLGIGPPSSGVGAMTLGASGSVMAVLLAYGLTWPQRTIMLAIPPIPIRALWIIPIIFALGLLDTRSNISHIGHAGGVLVGWIYLAREGLTRMPSLDGIKKSYSDYQRRQKRSREHQKMRENLRLIRREEERQDEEDPPKYH